MPQKNKKLFLEQEIESSLVLSRLPGVGAASFKELLNTYKTPTKALEAYQITAKNKKTKLDSNATLEFLKNHPEVYFSWLHSKYYPKMLANISEPPPVLFMLGHPSIANIRCLKVAIVGSREITSQGVALTQQITTHFCQQNAVIISGLAQGVDTYAHETALKHKAKTIAVIATGINVIYPKPNAELYSKIKKEGLICTEFFPDTPPRASFFPTRNRIIAALADIIIMIEGKKNSGALYTIKNGLKFQKKNYVCNPTIAGIQNQGLLQAIQHGAEVFEI